MHVNDEQTRIILQIFGREIINSPQVSLSHLPESLFGYFDIHNIRDIAQRYNGQYWDYYHRIKDDYLMLHMGSLKE